VERLKASNSPISPSMQMTIDHKRMVMMMMMMMMMMMQPVLALFDDHGREGPIKEELIKAFNSPISPSMQMTIDHKMMVMMMMMMMMMQPVLALFDDHGREGLIKEELVKAFNSPIVHEYAMAAGEHANSLKKAHKETRRADNAPAPAPARECAPRGFSPYTSDLPRLAPAPHKV
jgi:hypothetical protein